MAIYYIRYHITTRYDACAVLRPVNDGRLEIPDFKTSSAFGHKRRAIDHDTWCCERAAKSGKHPAPVRIHCEADMSFDGLVLSRQGFIRRHILFLVWSGPVLEGCPSKVKSAVNRPS